MNRNETLTFNDLPDAVSTLINKIDSMSLEIKNLQTVIPQQTTPQAENLVLGIFKPKEVVFATDKRLWEGDGAPFKSYNSVYNAISKGNCPFARGNQNNRYRIQVEKLADWIYNSAKLPTKTPFHKP